MLVIDVNRRRDGMASKTIGLRDRDQRRVKSHPTRQMASIPPRYPSNESKDIKLHLTSSYGLPEDVVIGP